LSYGCIKKPENYWITGLSLFILAILPLLVVKGVVSATDWVSDRPNNPYGFDVYHAEFLSVFLPLVSPLKMLNGNAVDWTLNGKAGLMWDYRPLYWRFPFS
jgi:hypothetical protein